jgi:hypothetical protein
LHGGKCEDSYRWKKMNWKSSFAKCGVSVEKEKEFSKKAPTQIELKKCQSD